MADVESLEQRIAAMAAMLAALAEGLRAQGEALQVLARNQTDFESGINTLVGALDMLTQKIFSDEIPGERAPEPVRLVRVN